MTVLLRICLALAELLLALPIPLLAQGKVEKQPAGSTPAAAPCKLFVKVHPKATLLIEGDPTKATGAERGFISPELEPGKNYQYTLVARWEPNNYQRFTRTFKVAVKAGDVVRVDMTKENPNIKDDIFVLYIPTPPEVVAAMCKLAGVGKDDVVFDLGCGDGRILIAAVKDFGALKGVGVDRDPERVKEAKDNVKKAMVEDKVEIRAEDVLKVPDLDQATVVMLYLSDESNQQLRPILQAKLKPGSRIVSHQFKMGNWNPDKTEKVKVAGVEEDVLIHLWKIEGKPDEKKPPEKKPEEKKPDEKKPEEKKPEEKKPEEKKPEEKKPEEKKPDEKKPEEKKPEEKKPEEKKPDLKPDDKKPDDKIEKKEEKKDDVKDDKKEAKEEKKD